MIPVPVYPAVEAADQWLVKALGFVERVRIGPGHRAQLSFGVGSLIVAEVGNDRVAPLGEQASESAMLRVADVAATCEHVLDRGSEVVQETCDYP